MIYVPVIFFSLMALCFVRRRGFDPSSYITFLYAVTTFFSVLIYRDSKLSLAYREELSEVTLLPTIVFCVLHSLFILPVYFFDFRRFKKLFFREEAFVKLMTCIYFMAFLMFVFFYYKDILFYATAGDQIKALRNSIYQGEQLPLSRYPAVLETLMLPLKVVSYFSYLMIFLYILMLAVKKRMSKWWHLMMVSGSLPAVILGVIGLDRSKTFNWLIFCGLSLSLLWRFLSDAKKKHLLKVGSVVVGALLLYFGSVTLFRFGQSGDSNDVQEGVVSYAGQSFIKFCYFFNRYESPEGVTLKHLFPATHHYLLGNYGGPVPYQQFLTSATGFECGVFYTHLGEFVTSAGVVGPFIITLVYLMLACRCFRCRGETIAFDGMLLIFLLLAIPSTGIIFYFYANYYLTITLVFFLLMLKILKKGNPQVADVTRSGEID